MTMEEPLLQQRDGDVVRLRFNRPEALNAIDAAMAQRFRAACADIAADGSVRCVLLSGEGRAFMAGGDLAAMRADPLRAADDLIEPLHEGLRTLARIDAPLVAAVHGAVAGAGLSLMLAADLAIAAEGARFNLAYVNVGTSCDVGASFALPRIVGLRKAMEIALLGETFDAQEALRLTLVQRVVSSVDLEREALALAHRLAAGPPRALGAMRRLMRSSFDRGLEAQLDAEAAAFRGCAATEDFREAVQAFFEKRRPRFVGR
jgi:2-(1,2-epoxy-1,2-dihydrophenyl)acetyl-CoA isomerase